MANFSFIIAFFFFFFFFCLFSLPANLYLISSYISSYITIYHIPHIIFLYLIYLILYVYMGGCSIHFLKPFHPWEKCSGSPSPPCILPLRISNQNVLFRGKECLSLSSYTGWLTDLGLAHHTCYIFFPLPFSFHGQNNNSFFPLFSVEMLVPCPFLLLEPYIFSLHLFWAGVPSLGLSFPLLLIII